MRLPEVRELREGLKDRPESLAFQLDHYYSKYLHLFRAMSDAFKDVWHISIDNALQRMSNEELRHERDGLGPYTRPAYARELEYRDAVHRYHFWAKWPRLAEYHHCLDHIERLKRESEQRELERKSTRAGLRAARKKRVQEGTERFDEDYLELRYSHFRREFMRLYSQMLEAFKTKYGLDLFNTRNSKSVPTAMWMETKRMHIYLLDSLDPTLFTNRGTPSVRHGHVPMLYDFWEAWEHYPEIKHRLQQLNEVAMMLFHRRYGGKPDERFALDASYTQPGKLVETETFDEGKRFREQYEYYKQRFEDLLDDQLSDFHERVGPGRMSDYRMSEPFDVVSVPWLRARKDKGSSLNFWVWKKWKHAEELREIIALYGKAANRYKPYQDSHG